jgi:GGDEF domain-containing protein
MRRLLGAAAIVCYGVVFTAFVLFERPGLGIGHFYYIAIVLVAMASGPVGGAAGALVATGLYALGVYFNPRVPVGNVVTVATGIRLVTYLVVGTLIGYYASRSRMLLARAEELMHELNVLARRDVLSGLPNQRAFEQAANQRLEAAEPFVLVLCDLPASAKGADDPDRLLVFGERLTRAVDAEADVARVGNEQFAVLAAFGEEQAAVTVTAGIERALALDGRRATAGWATFPRDAHDALGLYTAASERLYARKIARGEWVEATLAGG